MSLYSVLPWIVAQAEQAAEPAAADEFGGALRLLLAAGVIVGSFVAGAVIARALRLPDYGWKIGLVLFALVASVAICVAGWPPKLGIDLSGGVVLVYEVDAAAATPSWMPVAVEQLNDELNRAGDQKVEVRAAGADKIEIVTPGGFDPEVIGRAVGKLRDSVGVDFSSAGQPQSADGRTTFFYSAPRSQSSLVMSDLIAAVGRRINPGGVKELTIRQYGAEQLEVIIPEVEKQAVEQIKKRISTSGLLEFRIVANQNDDRDIIRAAEKTPGNDVYIGGKLVGRWVKAGPEFFLGQDTQTVFRETPDRGREVLVRIDRFGVDGGNLASASKGYDQGQLAVNFSFDAAGAQRFGQLTSQNLPDTATGFYRHLGIILDNEMLSAPRIISTIRGNGQITGNFTDKEVTFLVDVLNAGSLPASLYPEPISEQRISSQLGDDTIRQGSMAMMVSTGVVLLFMLLYYRFSGLVADICVILNVLMVVAFMILIKAAFTLPGLAGLVLSIGMSVDANVLIYERMREEAARGASLRMTIRNGFSRAMSAIVDSNVTTVMTAIVLYIIGTDQIKGFGVTLTLGLLVNLFTAVFVARVIFDVAERKRWITQLRMMRMIPATNFDFIRWSLPVTVASCALIVVGFGAVVARGKGILDIDFTGGSSVHVLFAEGKGRDIGEVRDVVASLPDVAVSSVGEESREFKIDTSDPNILKVEGELQKAFGKDLQTYSMTYAELGTIEAPSAALPGDVKSAGAPAADEAKSDSPAADEASPTEEAAPSATPKEESAGEAASPEPAESPAATESDKAAEPEPESSSSRRRVVDAVEVASLDDSVAIAALVAAQDEPRAEEPAAKEPAADESPAAEEDAKAAETPPSSAFQEGAPATEGPVDAGSLVGGTRADLRFPQEISYEPLTEMVRQQLADAGHSNTPFTLGNPSYKAGSDATYAEWTLAIGLDREQTKALLDGMQQKLAETPVFPGSSQIGGKVAGDTQLMALYAMMASLVLIVVYIWIRFQNVVFGLAGVIALVHDVLVAVALLALSYYAAPYLEFLMVDPFKIGLTVVASLLTIIGYSINDKIVIFDRIREVRGKGQQLTPELINLSLNQTLSRTILTGGAVLIATLILYFAGGPGIHAFAFTMFIGVVAGTYSSVYIAAPLILWMQRSTAKGQAGVRGSSAALGSEARRAGV